MNPKKKYIVHTREIKAKTNVLECMEITTAATTSTTTTSSVKSANDVIALKSIKQIIAANNIHTKCRRTGPHYETTAI